VNTPTTVQLADGSSYTIPTGEPGSWAWARQANLISVAYRQLGQAELSATWAAEYDRRAAVYNAIEGGRDRAEVLAQFAEDLLTAPVKILQDVGGAVLSVGGSVVRTATTTLALVPVLLIAGLGVLVILAAKGQLPRTIEAARRRR
jgi:hypothetical protein